MKVIENINGLIKEFYEENFNEYNLNGEILNKCHNEKWLFLYFYKGKRNGLGRFVLDDGRKSFYYALNNGK